MNAASRITIRRLLLSREVGSMGVTNDQQTDLRQIPINPFDDLLFQLYPSLEVLCRAGRVFDTHELKDFPDIFDNKSAHPPPFIIQQISLMAMGKKDLLIRRQIMKDQTFMDFDPIKQGLVKPLHTGFSLSFCAKTVKIFFHLSGVFPFPVVVPPEEVKASGPVKLAHLPKNMTMGFPDGFKGSVFPKLIPVSDFNISEALIVVEI